MTSTSNTTPDTTPDTTPNHTDPGSYSAEPQTCYHCHLDNIEEPFCTPEEHPCKCPYPFHKQCVIEWLKECEKTRCRICNAKYRVRLQNVIEETEVRHERLGCREFIRHHHIKEQCAAVFHILTECMFWIFGLGILIFLSGGIPTSDNDLVFPVMETKQNTQWCIWAVFSYILVMLTTLAIELPFLLNSRPFDIPYSHTACCSGCGVMCGCSGEFRWRETWARLVLYVLPFNMVAIVAHLAGNLVGVFEFGLPWQITPSSLVLGLVIIWCLLVAYFTVRIGIWTTLCLRGMYRKYWIVERREVNITADLVPV